MKLEVIKYEQNWIDGLNRGDVGEQVVERWEQWDQMKMLQQLGLA